MTLRGFPIPWPGPTESLQEYQSVCTQQQLQRLVRKSSGPPFRPPLPHTPRSRDLPTPVPNADDAGGGCGDLQMERVETNCEHASNTQVESRYRPLLRSALPGSVIEQQLNDDNAMKDVTLLWPRTYLGCRSVVRGWCYVIAVCGR